MALTTTKLAFCFGVFVLGMMALGVAPASAQLGGVIDEETKANEQIRQIVRDLSPISDAKQRPYKSVEPISFKTQVVAGMNYFIKAKAVDADNRASIIHLRVYRHFKNPISLQGVLHDQPEDAVLRHFEPKEV